MPLLVFLLVRFAVTAPAITNLNAHDSRQLWDGLTEHMLIFSIVTSCVSTFTSFPRLFFYREEETPLGLGALGFVLLTTLILVFSVAIYALHEAVDTRDTAFWGGLALLVVTLAATFYMEVALANVRLRRGETSTV